MIVDLAIYDDLNENFASMPGSRHKNGGPLIFLNYSCIDKKNNKIHKVLQYFISITTDITSKYGFWVIIDMRKMDSHFLKYIVSEINTLKKNVHKIYIIKSNSFWSIKSLISSSFKTDIERLITPFRLQ
ncbi:hypothetical protein A3Q56_04712 [Intoshia linei]|uniref:CRAL-TRIO domain-containing protein n=1 Tax=Intoshia linei TaxID=1819745 RepID=A0A177AZY6_9BILA|nr:hypothetical protein A3Q56_04712 [Intoshia linei]